MGGGDGDGTKTLTAIGGAERQYIEAKTSVWWDIENCQVPKGCDPHAIAQNIRSALTKMNYCGQISISAYGDTNRITMSVQHALNSTGITLNHVPAGVKDASDKKILVDMLFWAVDNPAPANYLLISGDRDFSNALHQLRMRRYNILLAQPQNASAPLLAAANSVWLWTSLLAGGPPLTNDELPQFGSNNSVSKSEMTKTQVSEPMYTSQSTNPVEDNTFSGNQKFFSPVKAADNKYKGKQLRKNQSQPNISRTTSAPVASQENKSNGSSQQQHPYGVFPHEIRGVNRSTSSGPTPNSFSANPSHSVSNGMNTSLSGSTPNSFSANPNHSLSNGMNTSLSGPTPNSFSANPNHSLSNGMNTSSNYQHPYSHSSRPNLHVQPDFFPGNIFPPGSHTHGHHQMPFRPDGSALTSGPPTGPTFSSGPPNAPNFSSGPPNAPAFSSGPPNGPAFSPTPTTGPNSASGPSTISSDFGKLRISENLNSVHGMNFRPQTGGDPRPNSSMQYHNPPYPNGPQSAQITQTNPPFYHGMQNGRYANSPELRPPSSSGVGVNPISGWGTSGFPNPSEYVQGLIGVILLALNTLKDDKMIPNEANITDCIRHGDPKHRNADVRKALDSAIEHNMVVKHKIGMFNMYLRKNEAIWKCVNPIECKHLPKKIWDAIYIFLSSPGGRSAFMASKCRYEAAIILRKSCLKDLVLGDILQILNMVITQKKWVTVHSNDWQPINITLGSESDSGSKPGN